MRNNVIDLSGLDSTQQDLNLCSSFADSAFHPFVDLCTQNVGSGNIDSLPDIAPILDQTPPSHSTLTTHGRTTHSADRRRSLVSGCERSQRFREGLKARKLSNRNEIASLVSDFIAPNQGCRL